MNVKNKLIKKGMHEMYKERVIDGQKCKNLFNAPEVISDLVGFNIEMLLEYPDDDGLRLTNW